MARRRPQQAASAAPGPSTGEAKPSADALGGARAAVARGDLRRARTLARSVLAGNPADGARAEAHRLIDDTSPDKAALLSALLVLVTIAIAAAVALLMRR